jgi:Serine phosphatase RsbU, regulator of sigma subunit
VQVLDTLGSLVGFEPHSRYEQRSCNLHSGDVLLLYTDGITEAPNSRGERFDEENLRCALQWACQHYSTAQEILDHIIGQVQQFTGQTAPPSDDMTLLIIRVTG